MTHRAPAALAVAAAVLLAGCGGSAPSAGPREAVTGVGTRSGAEAAAPAGTASCPEQVGTPAADGLPELTLGCVTGPGEVDLTTLAAGRPVLLNVWASWCAPCVEEMPLLQQAQEELGEELLVLGVLTRDPTDSWVPTLQETGARYASVRDDRGALMAWAGSPGPPVTVLVRADGTVAHTELGAVADRAELAGLLAEHLGLELPA